MVFSHTDQIYILYFEGHINTPKQIKLGKRKLNEEMPEDGEGRSVYQPGGGGIHRKLDDSEDLKTKKQKQYGEEYKAKVGYTAFSRLTSWISLRNQIYFLINLIFYSNLYETRLSWIKNVQWSLFIKDIVTV